MSGLFLDLNLISNFPDEKFEKIIEMDRDHFPFPWDREQWVEIKSNQNYMISIFQKEKVDIGFCLFFISKVEGLAHLLKILILPDYRETGAAKRCFRQILKKLEEDQLSSIYLEVESSNMAALNLYKSLGFQSLTKKLHFYGRDRHAESMNLYLF